MVTFWILTASAGQGIENIDKSLALGGIICGDDHHGFGVREPGAFRIGGKSIEKQGNIPIVGV